LQFGVEIIWLLVYFEKAPRFARRLMFGETPMDHKQQSQLLASEGHTANAEFAVTPVWAVDGNHVYPVNDLREHSVEDCWCHPTDDEGVMVHNSLDGREFYERGDRKVS
jgi:hypothetical protein